MEWEDVQKAHVIALKKLDDMGEGGTAAVKRSLMRDCCALSLIPLRKHRHYSHEPLNTLVYLSSAQKCLPFPIWLSSRVGCIGWSGRTCRRHK